MDEKARDGQRPARTKATNLEDRDKMTDNPTCTLTSVSLTMLPNGQSMTVLRGKSQNGSVKSHLESLGSVMSLSQPPAVSRGNSFSEVGQFSQTIPHATVNTQEALYRINASLCSQQPLPEISGSQVEQNLVQLQYGRLDDGRGQMYHEKLNADNLPPSLSREISAMLRGDTEDPFLNTKQLESFGAQHDESFSVILENFGFEDDFDAAFPVMPEESDSGMEETGSSTDTVEFSSAPSSSGMSDGQELPEDNEGNLGFQFDLPNCKGDTVFEKATGSFPILFVNMRPVSAELFFRKKPKMGTYVTIRAAFIDQGRVGKPLGNCTNSNCPNQKTPQRWLMKKDAPYFQLCKPNETAPADESVVKFYDCKKLIAHFALRCFNSCFGTKSEIRVIFEARSSDGKIIGTRSLDVRVCAAPKRDHKEYLERVINGVQRKSRQKRKQEAKEEAADLVLTGQVRSADDLPKIKRMKTEEYPPDSTTAQLIAAGYLDNHDPLGPKAKGRLENGKVYVDLQLCFDDDPPGVSLARQAVSSAIFLQRLGSTIKLGVPVPVSEALPRNVHNGYFAVSSKSAAASQTLQTNPTNAEVLTAEDEAEVGRVLARCGLETISSSIFARAGVRTMTEVRQLKKRRVAEILSFCTPDVVADVMKKLRE